MKRADGKRVCRRSRESYAWSGRRTAAAHRWSLRSGSIDWRSSIAMHSPSTASGVATALRASKSRQNHSSVCSGSPLRSRPVKGQPPAPNARLGAAPPCELQPRRWPTQLTLREACPGSGIKGGVFFVRPSRFTANENYKNSRLHQSLRWLRPQHHQDSSIHTLFGLKPLGDARLHRTLEWLGPLT